MSRAPHVATLYVADPSGSFVPAPATAVINAARTIAAGKMRRGTVFDSPATARRLLPALLGNLEHEVFCVAHLDARHKLISFDEMFRGTIDGASVHPREVVKAALLNNAAACCFVHNHPSGTPEPSRADELITIRLKEALSLIDVRVLDHFIVAGDTVMSFAERGIL